MIITKKDKMNKYCFEPLEMDEELLENQKELDIELEREFFKRDVIRDDHQLLSCNIFVDLEFFKIEEPSDLTNLDSFSSQNNSSPRESDFVSKKTRFCHRKSFLTEGIQDMDFNPVSPHPENISMCFDEFTLELAKNEIELDSSDEQNLEQSFQSSNEKTENLKIEMNFKKLDEIDLIVKQIEQSTIKQQKKCCTCKKSLCLKLYCECFLSGQVCGVDCKCVNCKNTSEFDSFRHIIIQSMMSKKQTYKKLEMLRQPNALGISCVCKKSGCQQRYCECLKRGQECGAQCSCVGCKNGKCNRTGALCAENGTVQERKKKEIRKSRFPTAFNEKVKLYKILNAK